jgi:hypothetical protein
LDRHCSAQFAEFLLLLVIKGHGEPKISDQIVIGFNLVGAAMFGEVLDIAMSGFSSNEMSKARNIFLQVQTDFVHCVEACGGSLIL